MENSRIGDVSERDDHFKQNFLCLPNKDAPVKEVKMKHRQCPFVDEQLKQRMSERDRLLNIAKETNTRPKRGNPKTRNPETGILNGKTRIRNRESKNKAKLSSSNTQKLSCTFLACKSKKVNKKCTTQDELFFKRL